ncbi:MAG TPA: hypothetical protein VFQ53_32475 [Kofleriaceae bacterium]|nr:hypothetical protein [Kofleriaceae bacterium]
MTVLSSALRTGLVLGATACSFNPANGGDGGPPDDVRIDGDGSGSNMEAGEMMATDHLLISEIQVIMTFEFVEIYNPTGGTIDLANYFLTDTNEYWKFPGVVSGSEAITMDSSDFLVQFPVGASIAPKGVVVVAVDGPDFMTEYGTLPTYTIATPVTGSGQMIPRVTGTGTLPPSLTNTGEFVALFQWDGAADLVKDVDIVIHGNAPTADNSPAAKSGIDGPDGNTNASNYLTDALTLQDMPADAGGRKSYKRIAGEAGHEIDTGGNGLTGHDETTEQLRSTWDTAVSNGNPGVVEPGVK